MLLGQVSQNIIARFDSFFPPRHVLNPSSHFPTLQSEYKVGILSIGVIFTLTVIVIARRFLLENRWESGREKVEYNALVVYFSALIFQFNIDEYYLKIILEKLEKKDLLCAILDHFSRCYGKKNKREGVTLNVFHQQVDGRLDQYLQGVMKQEAIILSIIEENERVRALPEDCFVGIKKEDRGREVARG